MRAGGCGFVASACEPGPAHRDIAKTDVDLLRELRGLIDSRAGYGTQFVATPSQELSWSHVVELLPLAQPLEREYYAEMCRIEAWNDAAAVDEEGTAGMNPEHQQLEWKVWWRDEHGKWVYDFANAQGGLGRRRPSGRPRHRPSHRPSHLPSHLPSRPSHSIAGIMRIDMDSEVRDFRVASE